MSKAAPIILSLILAMAVGLGAIPAAALPPMFVADKTAVVVGETVTFTNLFSLGTPPYTKAEWDFDGDGVFEITIVGTHAEVTANVVWAYDAPGVYSVVLIMTDSTPITRWVERPDYIIVTHGQPELNPHFVADRTEVAVGRWVTFTNLTIGGTEPYTKAEWDFDGDGIPEIILDVTFVDDPTTLWLDNDPLASVHWIYLTLGVYSVRLSMTDSTPITRWVERPDYIIVTHGQPELNPHFVADRTEVAVGRWVTFTNLTIGGTEPYTKAEWDFDGDGVFEITIVGTHAEVTANVVWAYDAPGVYSVVLIMTDSTPITRWMERPDYITVTGRKGDFDGNGDIDIFDFVQFADAYGSEAGDDNYNDIGDFDDDGHINIFDFVDFADVYGT